MLIFAVVIVVLLAITLGIPRIEAWHYDRRDLRAQRGKMRDYRRRNGVIDFTVSPDSLDTAVERERDYHAPGSDCPWP